MLKNHSLLSLVTIFTLSITSTVVTAQHKNQQQITVNNNFFYSNAKVVNIEPIIKNVQISTPERECWQEEITRPVTVHRNRGRADALFGGIIGGIVGNQFGRGDGKTAATVVGSIIGATIGNDISKKKHVIERSERVAIERHCRVSTNTRSEQRTEGYWVTYRYNNELFTTRMKHKPAQHVKVRIQITPVQE